MADNQPFGSLKMVWWARKRAYQPWANRWANWKSQSEKARDTNTFSDFAYQKYGLKAARRAPQFSKRWSFYCTYWKSHPMRVAFLFAFLGENKKATPLFSSVVSYLRKNTNTFRKTGTKNVRKTNVFRTFLYWSFYTSEPKMHQRSSRK